MPPPIFQKFYRLSATAEICLPRYNFATYNKVSHQNLIFVDIAEVSVHRNDTNFEKTEYNKRQKTQYLLQDKEDIVIRKTDKRKNCQRMITEYKTLKNRKDNRINSTLQRWIFPKKLLIFLCFVFLLPSTLSRCIT